jgi:hypothetical protein
VLVAGDVDVDNAARVDVRREEDGGEFDLERYSVSMSGSEGTKSVVLARRPCYAQGQIDGWEWMGRRCCTLTRRLSSVRSTATPASTLPTVNDTNMVKLFALFESIGVFTR